MSGALKLDAAGRLLLQAAALIEHNTLHAKRNSMDAQHAMHPARALFLMSGGRNKDGSHKKVNDAAWSRLCDCVGADFLDHSAIENIADLVAAAYWETA